MGGDEVLVEPLLDGEAAQARLGEDEHARGRREADDPAVLAKASPRAPGDHQHQDGDDARRDAVGVLDHGLGRGGRDHAALAERPSVRARALGAAAEAGVGDAHDPADQDQDEGGDDRGGDEAPEARQLSGRIHRAQDTGGRVGV